MIILHILFYLIMIFLIFLNVIASQLYGTEYYVKKNKKYHILIFLGFISIIGLYTYFIY